MVPILSSPWRGTHIPHNSSDAVAPEPVAGSHQPATATQIRACGVACCRSTRHNLG
ncbi:hypothetical protein HMPREF1162_1043 [ [[Propionibacterium] namnetense SK182B-JCVI]|uniref:Uncharacterized protein n=1 Tax=[Propionibacterium] namnetense SK182B-JCVI TaxID=1051006 RepID=F9NXP4_9ACTN|nr:hypothetical protein HMPREF1162_1043 [ [[Propionibacterium] namnetense SK182B-JCVI]